MQSWFTIPARMPSIEAERYIQEMTEHSVLLHLGSINKKLLSGLADFGH